MDDLEKRAVEIGWEALARLLDAKVKRLQAKERTSGLGRPKKPFNHLDIIGGIPFNFHSSNRSIAANVRIHKSKLKEIFGDIKQRSLENEISRLRRLYPPAPDAPRLTEAEREAGLRALLAHWESDS